MLLSDRYIGLHGFALSYEGDGTINMGSTGNVNVNVNTGATGNMTLQGTTLDAGAATPHFDNFAFVDATNHNVRDAKTADLTTNATPTMFITIDGSGNVTKSISPTTGLYRGHVSWTGWQQTITLPAGQTINAGASITATIENHASAGSVVIQVTSVGANTFDIETADAPTAGSFINYVVIN